MFKRIVLIGTAAAAIGLAANIPDPVTFHRDVLPLLQQRCQQCHRPGEVAPMSLLTYKETRPWAASIREAVLLKKMPPWFADPAHGSFSNDRRLSEREGFVDFAIPVDLDPARIAKPAKKKQVKKKQFTENKKAPPTGSD